MKFLPSPGCLPALGAALLLALPRPAHATTLPAEPVRGRPGVALALQRDLQAIPTGSQPTAEQTLAVANDFNKLLHRVAVVPTGTVDYVTERLVDAASQGTYGGDDLFNIARVVTAILNGRTTVNAEALASLKASLLRAGADAAGVDQLVAGLAALPSSFVYDTDGRTLGINLTVADPTAKGYKRATGTASLNTYEGPVIKQHLVVETDHLAQALTVQINQAPVGRYHVSVTTGASEAPVELGSFKVQPGYQVIPALDFHSAVGQREGARYGIISFGDGDYQTPLPAGVSLPDVQTITVADDQGIVQLTGSLANDASARKTHSARLHLVPAATEPTVGGSLSFSDESGGYVPGGFAALNSIIFLGRTFLLSAVGLPVNAALTLSVNGTAVETVTTGPTGKLFVKTSNAVFDAPPASTEVVNVLPDAVDLLAARSFALSDAQGNVLATAGF